ncbi:MAG: tetratricopeptide repeat protein [Candidatus Omnitrophica bacterium]|nr:tetratricopeptide repeat protein [Candidatus Omnitrophota bacterium]
MLNQSTSRLRTVLILVAILAVTFISFLPVLKGDFVLWDDDQHVLDNVHIRGLDLEHVQDMFTSTVNKIYIPLTSLSFALEYHFVGYKPFLYHLDNVLLHLAAVVLVFFLARRLGLAPLGAGVAALLFGIHPMRVESVAWVTERKDVLYAVFYLAAMTAYLRYLDGRKYFWLFLTTALGTLSMLAKPMALSLPLVLVLMDWFKGRPLKPPALLEKLPLAVLTAGIVWVTYSAHARIPGESVARSVLIWPWTFTFYLRQFVFPVFSVPVFRIPQPVSLANPEYLLSLLVFLAVVAAVIQFRRNRWFIFAVLFYFLSIFFLLRFDEIKDSTIVADRFMYLPGLGFSWWLGLGAQRLWARGAAKKAGRAALVCGLVIVAGLFSWKTFRQCGVWRDSMILWEHELKYFPDEPIALNNIATALEGKEEYQEAEKEYRAVMKMGLENVKKGLSPKAVGSLRRIEYLIGLYKRAIRSNPNFENAPFNLGNVYTHIGRFPEAVEAYKETLMINPKFKGAHAGIGDVYVQMGDARGAVAAYTRAIDLNPDEQEVYAGVVTAHTTALEKDPDQPVYRDARKETIRRYADFINARPPKSTSYFNLGLLYAEAGDNAGAVLAYRRALEINPRHAGALYNLGNVYKDQGDLAQALALYQKALEINPRMSDAYLNMGIIYGRQEQEARSREYYQKALDVDPKNAKSWFNLAFWEETAGNLAKAAELYQKSIACDPANAEGYYNLGNIYIKMNNNPAALAAYLKAVELKPEHVDAWVNLSILSFRQGNFADAVKYCDEAVSLGYDAPQEYLNTLAPYRNTGAGD